MEPLLVFESYNFANVDRSWIKSVWESAFTSVENVPADYLIFLESSDIIDLYGETRAAVKEWISQNSVKEESERPESAEAPTEVSWQTLVALNVDVQALLAVLAYSMRHGQAFNASHNSRQSCLRASGLYFVLLSIPGSNAFQAFHPGLYEIALKTLMLAQYLIAPDCKSSRKSQSDEPDDDSDTENEPEVFCRLSNSQSTLLTKGLNGVLYDLVTMIESARTSLEGRSLETTVFHLVEITKLGNETASDFSRVRSWTTPATTSTLAYNAYVALGLLCNAKYAPISLTMRTIGKYILPQLLISGNTEIPAKRMGVVRDSTMHFLKTLLEKHARETGLTLMTLVQHLMVKAPERLEGRQKQAAVLIKLMNLCRGYGTVYNECLKNLMQLSHHAKISCRIFAQEIIGKYLLDLASSQKIRWTEEDVRRASETMKLLLVGALSRCADSSSMVRGRAIATFAEYTDSVGSADVRDIFKEETAREVTEMPSLGDLVDVIDGKEVEKILPNFRSIVAMLRNRSEDERALVRRSSLQALRNGIFVAPGLLEEATPVIREHCRDSAQTVRRFAIRAMTALLERFPDNSSLCKDWVVSVVPRVFDAETRVQEEVLGSLEKLTLGKIAVAESSGENTREPADLPWRILSELASNKMGDHLAKACGVWSNRGAITSTAIANIKSHVGTANNVEAWLLLASIVESSSLENMIAYYSYYERALSDDSCEDGFLASLVVRVFGHCWPSFGGRSLRKMHEDTFENLKRYRVRETLISRCLDILHGIETLGAPEAPSGSEGGATTMRELARLSEATLARLVEFEDGGNNERDPGKTILRVTCTLGHASLLCSEKISLGSLRTLQGFLLEWNILPERLRARMELQGAAVAVLGQQALRDRDIAQEMAPIFGRLLRNTSQDWRNASVGNGPAVRINTAKALADICVRFTALVEPYLTDMCISMKDPNPEVRQVILVIFIQLLAEDFIKISGPFFFHILSMITDSDPTIRDMTVFLVKERLLTKNKRLVTQQFVNCVFHFNGYKRRVAENSQRKKEAKEREALTLPGERGNAERRRIYDFLLENLDAPGKFSILVGLSRQIFKSRCASSGSGPGQLNVGTQNGMCVFRDAIYVLSSQHLQPSSCMKQTADEDSQEDGSTPPITTASAAVPCEPSSTISNSVIVEAMKKHRLEILLPGLVELKRQFALANSPLVVDVAKLIANLISDYSKDQLENLYNEYPKLETEIERDIRECREEERPEKSLRESSTPKKSKYDATLLTNSDWNPRVVLHRISALTDPEASEPSTMAPFNFHPENVSRDTTGTASPQINVCHSSPRVVLRRLSSLTYPEISGIRVRTMANFCLDSATKDTERASSPSTSGQLSSRRVRKVPRI